MEVREGSNGGQRGEQLWSGRVAEEFRKGTNRSQGG